MIKDKYNGQSLGFGFVEIPGLSQAKTATKSLNEEDPLGKQISVKEICPRIDRESSGEQGVQKGRPDYRGRNRY